MYRFGMVEKGACMDGTIEEQRNIFRLYLFFYNYIG